jgi:hypothetical protein
MLLAFFYLIYFYFVVHLDYPPSFLLIFCFYFHSFETWLGLAGRPGTRLTRVEEKIEKVMARPTWRPGWPGKTRSKTWLQPVDFFFTKMTPFWIFLNWPGWPGDPVTRWPGQNPVTRSKLWTRALDRAGFKNYVYFYCCSLPIFSCLFLIITYYSSQTYPCYSVSPLLLCLSSIFFIFFCHFIPFNDAKFQLLLHLSV